MGSASVDQRKRRSLAVGALFLPVIIVLLSPSVAQAHAFLVNTSPQSGERLPSSPRVVLFQFSEAIVPGSQKIAIKASSGDEVAIESIELASENTRVRARVPNLDKGVYVVTWRVVSQDAHVEAGEFAFGVRVGGAIESFTGGGTASLRWQDSAASWLLLVGLVLAIGGLVSEMLVWASVGWQHRLPVPEAPIKTGLGVAAVGAVIQLTLLATRTDGSSLVSAVTTRPGILSVVQASCVAVALFLILARLRPWALLPLAVVVVATAWRGHSGTSGQWWAAPANALHVALAGVWVGALIHLVIVLWRLRGQGAGYSLRDAAQRYARMALILLPPLVALGAVTALAEFTSFNELTGTTYGRVLLLKLALVAAALLFALIARLCALRADPARMSRLRRLVSAESGALVAVIAVTAVLVNVAPPRAALASGDLLGPPPVPSPAVRLAERTGELSVYLAAASDVLRLEVRGVGDDPINAELELSGTDAEGEAFTLYPRICGPDCFTMEFDWRAGVTHLSATLSSDKWKAGTVDFAVPWPPRPAKQRLLDRVIRTMRRQDEIILKEAVTSTGGDPPFRAFPVTGTYFASQELYGAGGSVDIGYLPAGKGLTSVSLYLPGSDTWNRLWIDDRHRLLRELIINRGHRIERRIDYGPEISGRG